MTFDDIVAAAVASLDDDDPLEVKLNQVIGVCSELFHDISQLIEDIEEFLQEPVTDQRLTLENKPVNSGIYLFRVYSHSPELLPRYPSGFT